MPEPVRVCACHLISKREGILGSASLDLLGSPERSWLTFPFGGPRLLGVAVALARLIKQNINEALLCYTGCTRGYLSKRRSATGCNEVNMADVLTILSTQLL